MPKINYKTWSDNESVSADDLNEQIRDNGNEIWKGLAAGDLDFYSGSTTKARIPIGSAGYILQSAGSQPAWKGYEGARVYSSASQLIASGSTTLTEINSFNAESFDTDNFHTTTSGCIVIPAGFDGLYLIGAGGYYQANATANKARHIELFASGSSLAGQTSCNGDNSLMYLSVVSIYSLNAGDKVYMKTMQTSGVNLYLITPYLFAVRLK